VIVEEFVRQVAAITVLESREPVGDLRIVPAVRGLGRQQRVEERDGGVDAPHDAEAASARLACSTSRCRIGARADQPGNAL
jgi:hypothetical protein